MLACSGCPHMSDVFAQYFKKRQDLVIGGLFPPHHDGQGRFPGADIAAGYRGIQCGYAIFFGCGVDSAGQIRAGSRHIDQDHAGFCTRQYTLIAHKNLIHISRESDNGKDDVADAGHTQGRGAPLRSPGNEVVGFAPGAIEDGHLMARSQQMSAHGTSHDTGSDPTNLEMFHACILFVRALIYCSSCADPSVAAFGHIR